MRRLGVVLLALGLAACGGGTDESDSLPDTVEEYTTTSAPPGRSFAEWQEATRAVCVHFEEVGAAREAELDSEPDTQAEALAYVDALIPFFREYLAALRAVPVPTERTRVVEQLHGQLDIIEQGFTSLRDAVARGDGPAIQATAGWVTNYADVDVLFAQLDLPECTSDEP